jgi:hypothetical protein
MAWQRWSESHGNAARRLGWLGVVGGLLLTLSGCDNVGYLFPPPDTPGASGTGTNSALVGEWESIRIITVGTDRQTFINNWLFRSDRSCRFDQIVKSVAQSDSTEELRTCLWADLISAIEVTWDDTGVTDSLLYSFVSLDPNRLQLQGIEYQRVQ